MKRAPCKIIDLSQSGQRHLTMYTLMAGAAGVGLLPMSQNAAAKIIYTPAHVTLQDEIPFALDLNHDGNIDFYLVRRGRFHGRTASGSYLSVCHGPLSSVGFCATSSHAKNLLNAVRVLPSGDANDLRAGAKIQRNERFLAKVAVLMGSANHIHTSGGHSSYSNWNGPWVNGGKGVKNRYLGLKFKINGKFHFGWARMTVDASKTSFKAILTGYAYETTPGKAIIAGVTEDSDHGETKASAHTPAPATLGTLSLGAPGLAIWRREEAAIASHKPI